MPTRFEQTEEIMTWNRPETRSLVLMDVDTAEDEREFAPPVPGFGDAPDAPEIWAADEEEAEDDLEDDEYDDDDFDDDLDDLDDLDLDEDDLDEDELDEDELDEDDDLDDEFDEEDEAD